LFLQAAARLKEIFSGRTAPAESRDLPSPRFLIVGDGNLRHELEAQAKSLGLERDVSFLGTRNDPEDFYPALDIVALSSLNEGTPLTLIEAMANARPVVATAVGGVVDLLGGTIPPEAGEPGYTLCERGVLVRSGDAEGFARGLARLIEDKALRDELSKRGRDFVLLHYRKERLLADMSELYAEMLVNRRTVSEVTRSGSPAVRKGAVISDEPTVEDYRARLTPRA